jgi:MFS family permease
MNAESKLTFGIGWRLSLLWALQWGITGALLTYLPIYFRDNGLSQEQLGKLMAVAATGLWGAPFIVGQLCDRWMSAEKYLALAHFTGGVLLLSIPVATEMFRATGTYFPALMVLVGLFSFAYFPTIPLASAMTFRHLPDPSRDFGKVRIWGTFGWMFAGWALSLWLGRTDAYRWVSENFPSVQPTLDQLSYTFRWLAPPSSADCFTMAAILSFALASFCVFLPATPPERKPRNKIAPLATLKMFTDKTFTQLIVISFLLALVIPFYAYAAPQLLDQLGYEKDWIPALMTLGQISEFPALILLPFFLRRYGLKWTFAFGLMGWLLRYAFFVLEEPKWLILTSIALQGVCHVFLIIVIQLFIDSRAAADQRISAQNLFAFLTMGIAMPLGFLAGGKIGDRLTNADTGEMNYQLFFLLPSVAILALFLAFYRYVNIEEPPAAETDTLHEQFSGDASSPA